MYKLKDAKEIAPQLVLCASGSACLCETSWTWRSSVPAGQEITQITSSSSQGEFISSAESQLMITPGACGHTGVLCHPVQTAPANSPLC